MFASNCCVFHNFSRNSAFQSRLDFIVFASLFAWYETYQYQDGKEPELIEIIIRIESWTQDISPQVYKRISREIQQFQQEPSEGIRLVINDECLADIQAFILGPGPLLACCCLVWFHMISQTGRRTKAGVLKYRCSLRANIQLPLRNVSLDCLKNGEHWLDLRRRLFYHENLSPKRLQEWGDLCEHAEKGLEKGIGHCTYSSGSFRMNDF